MAVNTKESLIAGSSNLKTQIKSQYPSLKENETLIFSVIVLIKS